MNNNFYYTIIFIMLWVIARICEVNYSRKKKLNKNMSNQCSAKLYLGDDYGDNTCTIKCQLPKMHPGKHEEKFDRNGEVLVSWVKDERRIKLVAIVDVADIEKTSDEIWNYGQITDILTENGKIMIECDQDQISNISKIIEIKHIQNEGFVDD